MTYTEYSGPWGVFARYISDGQGDIQDRMWTEKDK